MFPAHGRYMQWDARVNNLSIECEPQFAVISPCDCQKQAPITVVKARVVQGMIELLLINNEGLYMYV